MVNDMFPLISASTEFYEGDPMPFLPLFIVIGIFLATSKILQPSQSVPEQTTRQDFDDKSLSLVLMDYISREAKSKADYDDHDSRPGSRSRKRRTSR